MKGTPHIEVTEENVIAKTVLMPGDPLRAKFIVEKYLENVTCFNHIRNMYGYTGTYKGHKVSVMGSGMGMPSIGIYSYELFKFYGVENIIRIGSAGSYLEDLHLFDVVLAESAYSESSFAFAQNGSKDVVIYPSSELNQKILKKAAERNLPLRYGRVHSSDVFYHEANVTNEMRDKWQCLCVEMESFALFHNARVLGKNAACILTISDSLVSDAITSPFERQTAFNKMVELALETAITL